MRWARMLLAAWALLWWPSSCMQERDAQPASVIEEVYPDPYGDRVLRDVYGPSELRPQLVPDRLYDGQRTLQED